MTLRVVEPGLYTLLVDHGRPGSRSLGVPLGGAADRAALALGNALVGNPPDTPALEISLTGPTLDTTSDVACVLYGAPVDASTNRRPLREGWTFTLRSRETLRIGGVREGMRVYLCIRGGLRTQRLLGSASGLAPLRAGDELDCESTETKTISFRPPLPPDHDPETLRILDGPQADWFDRSAFMSQSFRVRPESNRMGLRLSGIPLVLPPRELTSEPVCPGTVQVTRDGQCIILGVDGQTIGGYPKVAQVIRADLDRVGQLRPGETLRFRCVTLDEAEAAYHRRRRWLNEWVTRGLTVSGRGS